MSLEPRTSCTRSNGRLFQRAGATAVFLAACHASHAQRAADWPNFRGPNHDGVSPERGLKLTWDGPIPRVWERTLGDAFSSFAIVGDRLYTCGTVDKQQTLFCLNADTGEELWKQSFEEQIRDPQGGDGTRATPTVHDGRVYVLGGHGKVICFDAADGKMIWNRQLRHKPIWGYSGSVLIEGDLAVVSAGDSEGSLLALDRKTGKEIWKTGKDPVGYATPYPFTFNGKRYIAGFMGDCALVVEAANGREVWRMAWKTDWNVNASSPIYHDGHLFFSSGYNHGCIVLKLSAEGDKLSAKPVWQGRALRNKFQSCVLHEGHLYTSDETALKCVEFLTGREKWKKARVEHGTLVLADGHLFILTQNGKLVIAPATPRSFKALTTADLLDDRCWTVPVLHNGRIYARNLSRVACFDLTPQ